MKMIPLTFTIWVVLASCDNIQIAELKNNPTHLNLPMNSDSQITKHISNTLANDSSLSENAKKISVSTTNGEVTLFGIVNSQAERDKVVQMAKTTQGVKNVKDNLTVRI